MAAASKTGGTRGRFDGCDLSRCAAPRSANVTVWTMATVAQWDDLLQGEELAHVALEPARPARTTGLPADLHAAVRGALARQGIEELYAHQAHAWEAAR